jgi:hypothetical protein
MLHLALLFVVAATATQAPAPAANAPRLYRVDLAGGQSSWAMGKPQPNGALLLFRHYPDGALMSVRAKDVKQVVAGRPPEPGKRLQPGQAVEIGATGGSLASSGGGASGKTSAVVPPGARPDGSALFNPNRAYNPTWDSKLVPGSTMGLPNSPNDYAEGKTIAHPPAPAVQAAPGDVPRTPEQ